MATEEQIKHVAQRIREETIRRQRSRINEYLKTNVTFVKSTPPPNVVKAVFDLAQRTLPTYHNEIDLEKALSVIDLGKIYDRVEEKEREQMESSCHRSRDGVLLAYSDFLVKELLRWYKEDFFTWVNSPKCGNCADRIGDVKAVGRAAPTREESQIGGASVVEVYKCFRCQQTIRFPRYNKLNKLLDWRQGRCGEWNNCFILLLNALNLKARYVWNAEDHVWCEYYSESMQRWVHLDSCENSFDEPLLYNQGWGKKMSYVFGVGDDYIIDLSDKYVIKNKLPRNAASGQDLMKWISFHNFNKWAKLGDEELYLVLVNYNKELKILKPEATKTQGLKPRQSGKGEWTQTRGEAGN